MLVGRGEDVEENRGLLSRFEWRTYGDELQLPPPGAPEGLD